MKKKKDVVSRAEVLFCRIFFAVILPPNAPTPAFIYSRYPLTVLDFVPSFFFLLYGGVGV